MVIQSDTLIAIPSSALEEEEEEGESTSAPALTLSTTSDNVMAIKPSPSHDKHLHDNKNEGGNESIVLLVSSSTNNNSNGILQKDTSITNSSSSSTSSSGTSIIRDTPPVINKENKTVTVPVPAPAPAPAPTSSISLNDRPCRVIIENPIDYHHEVIESVVNRYPLPWHKFNCSTKYPIIYDFSLFQNRFPDRIPFYIGKRPKHLNQTEFWGWKTYFENNLQYRNITRREREGAGMGGIGSTTTVAYYRHFVSNDEYSRGFGKEADAVIDVSCGIDMNFINALKEQKNRYCVLHNEVLGLEEIVKNKTCWVSPMYPSDYCTFLPVDLPRLDSKTLLRMHGADVDEEMVDNDKEHTLQGNKTDCNSRSSNNHNLNQTLSYRRSIRVCAVGGGGRDHSKTVRMFSKVPYRDHNVTLIFSARRIPQKVKKVVSQLGLDGYVQFTYVKDYMEFAKFVSSCDIYLPCTNPKERKSHFPWGTKHLTGSIPQIIAYNLSSVMHSDLEAIYHDYLKAPVEIYNNETGSDAEALKRMISRLGVAAVVNGTIC
jgi:hypothetical protein